MAYTHIDLIGLNKYEMEDAPIVRTNDELITLAAASGDKSISIAGMRHSQGGHTALDGGRMVFTEAMKRNIVVAPDKKTVTVNAGATWSDLHFVLGPMGLAPLVHQSSPHFSIGGSLSVDCHGREVHEGALSNTVVSIVVLTNVVDQGFKKTLASRDTNSGLFFAALGGYGACGVILEATLRITKNKYLQKIADKTNTLEKLQKRLAIAANEKRFVHADMPITMFYAWMNLTTDSDKYLKTAAVFEYFDEYPQRPEHRMRSQYFKDEGWSTVEALRAGWAGGRNNRLVRTELFDLIVNQVTSNRDSIDSLINYLREEISFTSTKGNADDVDLLQEYFLPVNEVTEFFEGLLLLFPCQNTEPPDNLLDEELLTCTLRIVQPYGDRGTPFLSYGKKNEVMVSIALEIKVRKVRIDAHDNEKYPKYVVCDEAIHKLRSVIDLAQKLGGSYYLPYYQIATQDQFKLAYPNNSDWKKQANLWNPINATTEKRAFSNQFIDIYLDEHAA